MLEEKISYLREIQSRYQLSSDLHYNKLGTEIVILDMKKGEYYSLNSTGTSIWELLEMKEQAKEEILQWPLSVKELQADIHECLQDLVDNGLIVSNEAKN